MPGFWGLWEHDTRGPTPAMEAPQLPPEWKAFEAFWSLKDQRVKVFKQDRLALLSPSQGLFVIEVWDLVLDPRLAWVVNLEQSSCLSLPKY